MKQFILPLIAFIIGSANAQIEYESPHVKDGKTIQFTIPKGYYEVANSWLSGTAAFASIEGLDFEDDEMDTLSMGMIAILHVEKEEQTLESFIADLKEDVIDKNENAIIVGEPEIVNVKGRDCIYAGLKGEINGDLTDGLFFSIIEFGDYFILLSYYAINEPPSLLDYSDFKKMMTTWDVHVTDKEDGMPKFDVNFEETEYEETDYINDLFETEITYDDILPDYGEHWDEPMEGNSHLLCEFVYKEDKGSMKVFSGGEAANYDIIEEKAKVIQLAMDLPNRIKLKYDSEFSNEDHLFRLYSISGGGTMSSVYITEVNKELVFFVVDGGSSPVSDFKPAVRDFMLDMWVDSVVEESGITDEK